MKYYIRFLFCAVLCGIVFWGSTTTPNNIIYASDIIISLGFGVVECIPRCIIDITYYFTPILIFQILYGTYIYRHFCSASVYYFSRTENKIRWYLKQTIELFVFSLLYVILLLGASMAAASIFNDVIFRKNDMVLGCYFLVIYVLFLFTTTNFINILAILFSSNIAFIIVNAVQILSMALFVMADTIFLENEIAKKNLYILLNPIAHLIIRVHTGKNEEMCSLYSIIGRGFDFNISISVYLAFALVSLISGCIIVKHKDVAGSNEQEGF